MDKTVYLLRHCAAAGQEPSAELTEEGKEQAFQLVHFFNDRGIKCILSSPYTRAVQSVEPLANHLGLPLQTDERLAEQWLKSGNMKEWFVRIKESIQNRELEMTGGKSIDDLTAGAMEVFKEAPNGTVLCIHGNIMGLMLKQIDGVAGFKEWIGLSHPDVYEVNVKDGNYHVKRIWE
ncbi:histidine phosphatase family protein [Planococcus lenghuensis]|uniref:Histidine phosphatase family protein n=1 Tax=Planococcus lenghuensis TaxID=2213202 RepID=A0A1Q2L2A4_9BACL|nr:histidine phosphatase family protein [Planococcus lenghuensis]AQQ54569.1 histidine phosphatase family protein [Planococcus lenghuensis]